jgi:hypothetical protein
MSARTFYTFHHWLGATSSGYGQSWILDARNTTDLAKDNQTARFTPCALPYVATFPAVLGAVVLLTYSLRIFNAYQPRWTKPFIKEKKERSDELGSMFWSLPVSATLGLLVVSMAGLTMQLLASFLPNFSYEGVYPSVAWVRHSCPFRA